METPFKNSGILNPGLLSLKTQHIIRPSAVPLLRGRGLPMKQNLALNA